MLRRPPPCRPGRRSRLFTSRLSGEPRRSGPVSQCVLPTPAPTGSLLWKAGRWPGHRRWVARWRPVAAVVGWGGWGRRPQARRPIEKAIDLGSSSPSWSPTLVAGDLGGEGLDERQREHLGHLVVQGFKTREDGHLRQCRGVTRLLGADPWGVDLSVSLHFFFFFFRPLRGGHRDQGRASRRPRRSAPLRVGPLTRTGAPPTVPPDLDGYADGLPNECPSHGRRAASRVPHVSFPVRHQKRRPPCRSAEALSPGVAIAVLPALPPSSSAATGRWEGRAAATGRWEGRAPKTSPPLDVCR